MANHCCPHTPGITCDEQNPSCRWCGWHPKETERRKAMIDNGKMYKSELFNKQWLRLKASERV